MIPWGYTPILGRSSGPRKGSILGGPKRWPKWPILGSQNMVIKHDKNNSEKQCETCQAGVERFWALLHHVFSCFYHDVFDQSWVMTQGPKNHDLDMSNLMISRCRDLMRWPRSEVVDHPETMGGTPKWTILDRFWHPFLRGWSRPWPMVGIPHGIRLHSSLNPETLTILSKPFQTLKKGGLKRVPKRSISGGPTLDPRGPTPPRSWDDHGRSRISGPGVVQNHRFLTIFDTPFSGHEGLCTKVQESPWDPGSRGLGSPGVVTPCT